MPSRAASATQRGKGAAETFFCTRRQKSGILEASIPSFPGATHTPTRRSSPVYIGKGQGLADNSVASPGECVLSMTAAEIRASCWPAILPALRLRMPPILLDLGDEPFGKLSARGGWGVWGREPSI